MEPQSPTKDAIRTAHRAIKKKMAGYIAAGLGLVAGLAWNDAIRVAIDYFLPDKGHTVIAKILYALIITVVVGILLFSVEKTLEDTSSNS